MKPNSSILITRRLKSNSLLRDWIEENGFVLEEQAFIKIEAIRHLEIPKTAWIFFSSPAGAELFLDNYKIEAKKIGVFGEGTNEILVNHGLTASFIGDSSKTSAEIARKFFEEVQNESVLFPISQLSKRNISSHGNPNQIVELNSYRTQLVEKNLAEKPTIIIFTSTSNVDGYLFSNQISEENKIIVFGETTAKHLCDFMDEKKILIPNSPKEKDLILLLSQLD